MLNVMVSKESEYSCKDQNTVIDSWKDLTPTESEEEKERPDTRIDFHIENMEPSVSKVCNEFNMVGMKEVIPESPACFDNDLFQYDNSNHHSPLSPNRNTLSLTNILPHSTKSIHSLVTPPPFLF